MFGNTNSLSGSVLFSHLGFQGIIYLDTYKPFNRLLIRNMCGISENVRLTFKYEKQNYIIIVGSLPFCL